MLVFWLATIVLCCITLWVLWRPLISHSTLKMESVQQRNVAIARERALEIDSLLEADELTQSEHEQAKQDLELALADELATSAELGEQFRSTSTVSHYLILALVPLMAYGLYSTTTNYQPNSSTAAALVQNGEVPSVEELLSRLEEKVNANPQDQQGLFLLAQSYARTGRYAEAAARFEQLIEITQPNADLYASLADVQAMANNQIFDEKISSTLDKALALNPQHVSALWLSGLAKQQLGQPEIALQRWLKLKPIISADVDASQELAILIKDVSAQLGPKADQIVAELSTQSPSPEAGNNNIAISVTVSLDPALQAEVKPGDTVFIYAKAKSGPPMPLAAARQPVSALPITITLDDSMALLPSMKLSDFAEVLVGARISSSGQAIAQSGDLESDVIATSNTAKETIEILVSKRKP